MSLTLFVLLLFDLEPLRQIIIIIVIIIIIIIISSRHIINRVGHLILIALAIRASDPENALAWTSFHSPKSTPPPLRLPNILVIFYCGLKKSPQPSWHAISRTIYNDDNNNINNYSNVLLAF